MTTCIVCYTDRCGCTRGKRAPWDSHGVGVLDRTRLFQGYQVSGSPQPFAKAMGLPRSWSPRSNETVSRVSGVGESRAICKGHGTPTKLESSIERDCFKGIRCRGVPSHLQRLWDSHEVGVLDRTRLFQGYQVSGSPQPFAKAVGLPRSWSPRSNETVSRVSGVGESPAICKGHGTPTELESSIERDCFKGTSASGRYLLFASAVGVP